MMRPLKNHPWLRPFKHLYWRLLYALGRTSSVDIITPHPWLEGIARNVAGKGDKLVIVDGGAFDGRTSRQFLRRFPQADVYAFEPMPQAYADLCRTAQGMPIHVYPQALAAQSGRVVMNVTVAPMACSALAAGPEAGRYHDALHTQGRQPVAATSLDDWAQAQGLDHIDVLKLDLQGYELEALRGAERLLQQGITCIYLEVNFTHSYAGAPTLTDLDLFLRQRGYRLFNFYNQHSWRADGQISGGDVLFVRQRPPAAPTMHDEVTTTTQSPMALAA